MTKKITIEEIAKRCNLSIAAVSYVLNGVNKVSEEKKALVLKTIEEMGYQRNLNAVALSKNESKLICIILPLVETEDRLESIIRANPFYMEFVSGAESAAEELGYDIILSANKKDKDFRGWLTSRSIDAIVAFDSITDQNIADIKRLNIPCCLVDARKIEDFVNVSIKDEDGEFDATKYLLSKNHTKIGFAGSSLSKSFVNMNRFEGYKNALKSENIDINENYIFEGNVSYEEGIKIAEKIVNNNIDITSLVATSDILALGIIKGLNNLGKKVPEDLSIIGYDDIQMASYITPSLTTVRQNTFQKGKVAIEQLIKKLKDGEAEDVILDTELIIRNSVKDL